MARFNTAADIEAFFNQMFKAMDDLVEAIEAETDLVRAGQLLGAAALQPQKTKCAETYMQLIEQAKTHGSSIKTISPKMAEKLIDAQHKFKSLLQINMAALSAARDLSQNLIRGVAENMSKRENPTTYTAAGGSSSAYAQPAKGIAINRDL